MRTKSTLFILLLASVCNITPAKAQVDVNDSLALVDLYNSTDGPNWNNQTNWLTGPVETWYGITVENERIAAIDLFYNNLNGIIPSSIGNLSNLSFLQVGFNQLTSLPPEIGSLSNLSFLDLEVNPLTSLPPEIWNLSNLSRLGLAGNGLASLPPEIGNLSKLTDLVLQYNQLTSLPPEIGNLSKLTYLNLNDNQLTSLPREIGNLSNLTDLYLHYNQLTILPREIGNLSNLSFLDLEVNQLTSLPPEIGNLSNLTNLVLEDNQLTSLPPEIGNLSKLAGLLLQENQLTSLPREIGNLSNLTDLYLHHNQLTSLPQEIGNLSNLTFLPLEVNQLTSLPREIGNLSNLTNLGLKNNQLTSLPPEIGSLSKLTYLNLDHNQLTSLPSEMGTLSNLSYLNLVNNRLTFISLEMIVEKLSYVSRFYYYAQASIPIQQNGSALSASAGGTLSNNTYNWFELNGTGSTTITGDSIFHPLASGKYYAAVTNAVCTQLTLYTETIDYDATLPVNIINLKAQQQGNIIKVEWASLTEINVRNYEIQHSADSRNFTGIGLLPAKGNGVQQIEYAYTDVKPFNGDNFYRIKAADNDGKITYSNTVLVNMPDERNITLVYPNPAKNRLNVQINVSASFSLLNQTGKALFTKTITNSASIDISRFAAGLYYLKNNSTGEVQKVVVEK